jgi:phosphoglycerol transferase MdoB-like AlkP superfamily enzyme
MKKHVNQIVSFACNQYLILFFIFTVGLKLSIFNHYVIRTFPRSQIIPVIIFDFVCAITIFAVFYLIKRFKNTLAIALNIFISVILVIDTVYFAYFTSLPSVGLLSGAGQVGDVMPAVMRLLSWKLVLYFVDIVLAIILLKPVGRFIEKLKEKHEIVRLYRRTSLAAVLISFAIMIAALGCVGVAKLTDVINRGFDTISTSQYFGVLGAHTVDIARFIEQATAKLSVQQTKELTNWVKNKPTDQQDNTLTGIAKGKNVIMIQIESLGGFVINQKVNGKEVTPNLDKLASSSQFFPNNRFIIGGGHTADTDFVANTSYFPLLDSAVFIRYAQDDFTSLPKTLTASGYSAYAYHGYNRNFWNRSSALASIGYQKFYAADNYPKGEYINMGLNDGDFLSKTAEYIQSQPKPSLSYAITLSSHTPFDITNQTKELGINPSDYPDQVGGYLENINYTDRMLGNFFDKLKAEGLYDDSLIVVYGDHTPELSSFTAGTIQYDATGVQSKEVPLIIKLPNATSGQTYPKQGTSADITPTILDLLGIKTSNLMFGHSLFTEKSSQYQICPDQLVVLSNSEDCTNTVAKEKEVSEKIIRYNLFNILTKK